MHYTKRIVIVSAILLLLAPALVVNVVHAATATIGEVWTTDKNGTAKINFDLGEKVYIHWKADGTVNLRVEFEDGTIYGPWLNQPSEGSMEFSPPAQGVYSIYWTGAKTVLVAYGRFLVVPFTPLGGLVTLFACFAAVGTLKLRKTHAQSVPINEPACQFVVCLLYCLWTRFI